MPYIVIENFNGGMDTRRMAVAGTPGTLLELTNAHITRGGEIEKRKAFASRYSLPSGTVGMAADKDGVVVFGSGVDPGVPSGVTYQRLQHPSGQALTRILSWDLYAGKLYVAAEFANGDVYHFYDGDRVTSWFDGKARGLFTVAATSTDSGAVSDTQIFFYKQSEDLRAKLWVTDPDNPDDPIELTGGWVYADAADGPGTWAQAMESAVNAESATTGWEATYNLVGGHLLYLAATDTTKNWNGQRLWAEVEELNVFKVDPSSDSSTGTKVCTGSSSCGNVFRLASGVSGGASPYTYLWEILDAGGATAELSDDSVSDPELTVTAPTGYIDDGACYEHDVTLRCTVTDNTAAEVSKVISVRSRHCPPSAPPPAASPDPGGVYYRPR